MQMLILIGVTVPIDYEMKEEDAPAAAEPAEDHQDDDDDNTTFKME